MSPAEELPDRPRHLAPLPNLPPDVISLANTLVASEAGFAQPVLNNFCLGGFVELTEDGDIADEPTLHL